MTKQDAIFVVNNSVEEVSTFGSLIAPKGSNIKMKLKVGGESFTNGKIMEVGLFEFMINDNEDEFNPTYTRQHGKFVLKALTAHEYGHVWFTNFQVYKKFVEKYAEKFEKDGVNRLLAAKVVANIFNITEDGRIEQRMVNLYPGLLNYFRYIRGILWNRNDKVSEDELVNFINVLLSYATVGIKPKWAKDHKTERFMTEFNKIKNNVDKCVNAPTCKKNCEETGAIIDAVYDYLLELLKNIQKKHEKLQEILEQLLKDADFGEGCSEEASNSEESSGSGSSGSSISVRIKSDDEEGEEGEGEGKDKAAGSKSQGSGSGKNHERENTESGKPNKVGDNSGSAGPTRERKQEVPEYKEIKDFCTDMPDYDYSQISGDGGGSKKVIKSNEGHTTKTPEQRIEEIIKEVENDMKRQESKKPTPKEEKKNKTAKVTRDDISRIMTAVGYDKEYVRRYREERNSYYMMPLDSEYMAQANEFRRKVERFFKERNTLLNKQMSGRLNTKDLHRLAMKEYNIFQKKANRSDTNAVVQICWDGSGSMYGGKQHYSGIACSIIEEGLKRIVPLKIINFSVDWQHKEVVHYLVKDFDEKDTKINYSYSYMKSKGFNGGNKDGYSIRVCTEELLKRPEKDKILIVLSDGLPSDYNSINPQADVKDAVKTARKKGIIVIPIFFGDENFRESAVADYEFMYEKNIINSAPEELPDRLVHLLGKLVLR